MASAYFVTFALQVFMTSSCVTHQTLKLDPRRVPIGPSAHFMRLAK